MNKAVWAKPIIKFEPRDLWIGVYWDVVHLQKETVLMIYICIIPAFPIIYERRERR